MGVEGRFPVQTASLEAKPGPSPSSAPALKQLLWAHQRQRESILTRKRLVPADFLSKQYLQAGHTRQGSRL
jgi:hypothetical protein